MSINDDEPNAKNVKVAQFVFIIVYVEGVVIVAEKQNVNIND